MRHLAGIASTWIIVVAAACGGKGKPAAKVQERTPVVDEPVDAGGGGGEEERVSKVPVQGPVAPALRLDGSVRPSEYAVELTLDPAKDTFEGHVTIQAQIAAPTKMIWMHGKAMTIEHATVGGVDATPTLSGEFLGLGLASEVAAGPTTIEIAYQGKAPDDDEEGLFRQTEDGRTYLYSQFEATGARRAFPCFDEPSYKVPWQLTLHVPKGMVALSNTMPASEKDDGDQRTVVFARTHPLPSYLVALSVGPFDLVDLGKTGRNKVPLRAAVPKGRGADARYLKKVAGQLVAALEKYLDVPFPYDKLDMVVVPTFLGAMENPGMITYSERIILAKPSEETIEFQQGCAGTVAHEVAHHWFGDLVTMAWWDDIWLNESFADFMADRVVDEWQPKWGTRLHRLQSAQGAFAADSLMSARKIHNPIATHNDIVGAFDAISYAKGGSVLAMFEAWVGTDAFRKTLHDYLTAHAWGNASSQDFIDALAASRPEVSTSFATFLDQGGIPMVTVNLACPAGGAPTVSLAQERFLPIGSSGSADETWQVPMCVTAPSGKSLVNQCFLFSDKQSTVTLDGVTGCPAWIDGNPGGRGYYRVRYAGDLGKQLLGSGAIDTLSRAAALYNLRAMVDGGHAPMSELLAVLPDITRDRNPEILTVAFQLAQGIEPYVDDAQRDAYMRFLAASFTAPARTLGWKPRAGEPAVSARLRPQALAVATIYGHDAKLLAEAKKLAAGFLARPSSMSPDLGGIALAAATHAGDPIAAKLDAAFTRSDDHGVRAALLAGMVLSSDQAVRAKAIARLADGSLTLEELFTMVFTAASDPTSKAELYGFVVDHLDAVMAALPFLVRPAIVRFGSFYCDAEHRKALDTTFRAKVDNIPGGAKELKEALEGMDLCIAKKQAVGPDLSAFLAKQ